MKSVQIKTDLNYERVILTCIYWSTRKTKSLEGCAPISISKIITNNKTHLPISKRKLKLTLGLISDIQKDSDRFKLSEIEILVGKELLTIFFNNEMFYINTVKNKELESEITNKLETEFNKFIPRLCQNFVSKVLAQ